MRRNTRVVVQPRRGPGLMGTMARTAVIAGTATAVSGATANKMQQSAQAQQMQQQAQVQAMVDQKLAEQQALTEQQQLQQQLAEQQAQLQQLMQQQMAPQAAAAPIEAGPSAAEVRIMKLKELGALRDAGILTEAEFEAEKARILAG
ncbi:MAG TPA: SHOCT domain-containing protein [Promineifilum sp.]|nr:SHOCT domain-containing protein [Promineifilum sp.]